jgi:hypothetical protein
MTRFGLKLRTNEKNKENLTGHFLIKCFCTFLFSYGKDGECNDVKQMNLNECLYCY